MCTGGDGEACYSCSILLSMTRFILMNFINISFYNSSLNVPWLVGCCVEEEGEGLLGPLSPTQPSYYYHFCFSPLNQPLVDRCVVSPENNATLHDYCHGYVLVVAVFELLWLPEVHHKCKVPSSINQWS